MQAELMDQMQELAASVRVASGPDRDLDAEISWRLAPESAALQGGGLSVRNGDPHLSGTAVFSGLFPDWLTREDVVPRYTASLDAALELAGDEAEAALRYAVDHGRRPGLAYTCALALAVLAYLLDRT